MKLNALDRAGFLKLLIRLGGSGYTAEEESNRVIELTAWADIAAKVSETLESAFGNLFLAYASSALDKLEEVRFLVQGSILPEATRQARLLAFAQALPKMVPARLANAFANYLGATTGSTLSPTLAQLQAHRASPLGAFLVNRREPAATTELQRRDLAPIVARGLPGRAVFTGISQRDATWGDALDPASIKLAPVVTVAAQTKARVAPLEVAPGQIIRREEWIELQSQLCWKSHGFSVDQTQQGRTIYVNDTLASAASTTENSIDWSDRLIQVWGVVDDAAITDPTALTYGEHCWMAASKLGAAGAGYVHDLRDTNAPSNATGITFEANGSGDLVITNTTVGTRYLALIVRCSPKYTASSTTDTQPWMNADQIVHSDVEELYSSTVVSDSDDPGQFAGVDAGAIRRIVYTGPLRDEAGGGIPQGVTLDTSEDWRNRVVLVVPLMVFGVSYPTVGATGLLNPLSTPISAPRLFFTGAGQAMGNASVLANQHKCSFVPGNVAFDNAWLFARDTDGALVCEMKDGTSVSDNYTGLFLLIGTEQTTGDSVVTPVPVHATQIQSVDLEQPQNCGCYAQGRQGGVPRYLLTDADPAERPTAPPMGRISDGNSPVRPVKWEIRERLGAVDDGTWERRQPIDFQRKRLVSIHVPTGSTTPIDDFNVADELAPGVNDQFDARDRFVWMEGRVATSDITISDATQASDTAATPFLVHMYSGPGADIPTTIATNVVVKYEHTRNAAGRGLHSRLVVVNTSGADVWLNAMVEVTGYLGFTDRRAYGHA